MDQLFYGMQNLCRIFEKVASEIRAEICIYVVILGVILNVIIQDNKRRLTGKNETADITDCSSGVEDRQVALRIPIDVHLQKKVYNRNYIICFVQNIFQNKDKYTFILTTVKLKL